MLRLLAAVVERCRSPSDCGKSDGVDAAFVLVVHKRPGRRQRPAAAPSAADLGFAAGRRDEWSDPSGALTMTMWQRDGHGTPGPSAWRRDGAGVSLVVGYVLPQGDAAAPARWAGHVEDLASRLPARAVQRELRGIFLAVHLDGRGGGWVVGDPYGFRCLYVAEDDVVLVVSSRAALAAAGVNELGSAPARDAGAACWLAHTGYHVGYASGFRDVHVAPPGARLELIEGRPSWDGRSFLADQPDGPGEHVDVLAERVIDDVAGSLRAVLRHGGGEPVIRLTGGKDSRLILAVALSAGIADEFRYETVGYPGLADADVASELAERLGLRHEVSFIGRRPAEHYADRVRRFVAATGCMTNALVTDAPTGAEHVTVTGICGEALRAVEKLAEDVEPVDALERAMDPSRRNRLGLVRPELAERLDAELWRLLSEEPTPGADPFRRYHTLLLHRMRFARVGPREEIGGDPRVQPLYSHATIAAALSLPHEDRQSELLFAEVMRQSSPVLVAHRFAGPGWDARARAHLGLEAPVPARGSGTAVQEAKPPSLMTTLQKSPSDERAQLLAEVFGDLGNPAWEVLDRERAERALGRFEALPGSERNQLFGAATAAIWLGGS